MGLRFSTFFHRHNNRNSDSQNTNQEFTMENLRSFSSGHESSTSNPNISEAGYESDASCNSSASTAIISPCSAAAIIRPRPLVASTSAFSFDSGYEKSPICHCSFQFDEALNKSTRTSETETANSDATTEIIDDSIDGFDEELISIGQHFTPISSTTSGPNDSCDAVDSYDLSAQRRLNRLQQLELNNNDIFFPDNNNLEEGNQLDMFDLVEGDDNVFEDEPVQQEYDPAEFEPRHWHVPRPSCMIFPDQEDDEYSEMSDMSTSDDYPSVSSSPVRRSPPIDIPGARERAQLRDQEWNPTLPHRTYMHYYHPLAPPLSSGYVSGSGERRFGSGFETSREIIFRHPISRFSPPPMFELGPMAIYPGPYHARLSPQPELDEEESEWRLATSNDGLLFDLEMSSEESCNSRLLHSARCSGMDCMCRCQACSSMPVSGNQAEVVHHSTPRPSRSSRRVIHHRNTLPSISSYTEPDRLYPVTNERRTMSVSLPIEEEIIVAAGQRLREIGEEFSRSFQLERFNQLASMRTMFNFMRQLQRNASSAPPNPMPRVVNNSVFYTGANPPSPTGNSAFYVGLPRPGSTGTSLSSSDGTASPPDLPH